MPFTQQQQSQIDAAQKRLDDAQKEYDAAYTEVSNRDSLARQAWNKVFECKGFKGEVKNYEPLNIATCQGAVSNQNYPSCTTKTECETRVQIFNNAYAYWNSYVPYFNTANQKLADAKQNYQNVLDSIKEQVANDPELLAQLEQIQAEGATNRTKWLIFGIIAVVVIVVGTIVYFKYIRS